MTHPTKPLNSERVVLRGCLKVLDLWGLKGYVVRQNTGAFRNPAGKLVKCGVRGSADLGGVLPADWGSAAGKRIVIEVKREGFKPPKFNGKITKKWLHWRRQFEQLHVVNEAGGYGFWCDDDAYLSEALCLISNGYRVALNDREEPEFYRE